MLRFALLKVGYLSHYCSKFICRVLNTCEKAVSDMKLRIVALSYLEECKRVTYITIIVIYNLVNKRYMPLILLLAYQATLGFPCEKKTITFASYCCSLTPHFFLFPTITSSDLGRSRQWNWRLWYIFFGAHGVADWL